MAAAPSPAHFALWPLPDLRVVAANAAAPATPPVPSAAEQAYASGREEGRREARAALEVEWRNALQILASAAEVVRASRVRWLDTADENLFALATAVARQILDREVATEPALVLDLVRRALDELDAGGPIAIRLHPDDLTIVRERLDTTSAGDSPMDLEFIADPTMGRGGCIAEHAHRLVDGRIETAIQALYLRLRDG
jgi:flagellar biosynthesis/type III secretory pathway protein FliH